MGRALPVIARDGASVGARSDALYCAWLAGTCLATAGMALHHKVCHVLGGSFGLAHAETHTVMLPHVTAYNAVAAREAVGRVASSLGVPDAALGLFDLARSLGAPRSLRDLGMPEDGVPRAVHLVTKDQYWNPRPLEPSALEAMMRRAWAGDAPARQ